MKFCQEYWCQLEEEIVNQLGFNLNIKLNMFYNKGAQGVAQGAPTKREASSGVQNTQYTGNSQQVFSNQTGLVMTSQHSSQVKSNQSSMVPRKLGIANVDKNNKVLRKSPQTAVLSNVASSNRSQTDLISNHQQAQQIYTHNQQIARFQEQVPNIKFTHIHSQNPSQGTSHLNMQNSDPESIGNPQNIQQPQKLNSGNLNQKWPQYLNSLKNIEVSEPSSQAQYPSSGYSSQPSIKKPLASAKKANITGLSKGFPSRVQPSIGASYQNLANRKQHTKVGSRGTKQLRSDSPRQTDAKFKLSSNNLVGKQNNCQTQLSMGSGDDSRSPNLRCDQKSSHIKQIKGGTVGRVSRASDQASSIVGKTPGQNYKPKQNFQRNNYTTTTTSQRAKKNAMNSPKNNDEIMDMAGPRPFGKPPVTGSLVPKTQNPSIRNSPKLEISKAIFVATDGCDISFKDDSHSTKNALSNKLSQIAKSPRNVNNPVGAQSHLKIRFQNALQPHRHSRNQAKLNHGSSRHASKMNQSSSSYGISGNMMRFTNAGFGWSNNPLKSSPALWTGNKLEDERKKIPKGVGVVGDHLVPKATLHLAEGLSEQQRAKNTKVPGLIQKKQNEPGITGSQGLYGLMSPRRPSVVPSVNKHSRTNTIDVQDAVRSIDRDGKKTGKRKVSARSNQSREISRKRGSPATANCLSEQSGKSSGSKASVTLKSRKISSRKSQEFNMVLKEQKSKQIVLRQKQVYNMQNKTRGNNVLGREGLLNKHPLQGSGNLQSGVEALRKSGARQLDKKVSNPSMNQPAHKLSINRLRSYSPRVNLSQLQSIKAALTEKSENKKGEADKDKYSYLLLPASSYWQIQAATSAYNTVIVNSAQNYKFDRQKNQNVTESEDTISVNNRVVSINGLAQDSQQRNKDSIYPVNPTFSGSGSPGRRGVAGMNTTAGAPSLVNSSRFMASQGTTEGITKNTKKRDKSINSNIFSPKSREINESNFTKSNGNERVTIIDNNQQRITNSQANKNSRVSVQVSKVFLNMVESLLKNIEAQLNPRQVKDFERSMITLMTTKSKAIDPYLKIKCFQIESANVNQTSVEDHKIVERGNILHFLSASGHFANILDFILRKKCQAKHALNKNEMTTEIRSGKEYPGHTALHLACLSLRQKSIEKLLLSRVNVNLQTGKHMDTPLHLLIKIYHQQSAIQKINTEDIAPDIDLEDIKECIQLILPFCEESLNLKNMDKKKPCDLISGACFEPLSLLLNEQYPGYIDTGSLSPRSQLSSPRVTCFNQLNNVDLAINSDQNAEMEYVEVKAEELDEFIQTQNQRPGQNHQIIQSNKPNTHQKQQHNQQQQIVSIEKSGINAYSTQAQFGKDGQNQTLKNIIDQNMNINEQKSLQAEALTQSAQQAQRKESTRSYNQMSRKQELSEIEEKESPLECLVDQQTSNNYQQSSYQATINNTVPKPPNQNAVTNLQIDLQQIQQSQFLQNMANDQRNVSNIQCGEQSRETQDKHSGEAYTATNNVPQSQNTYQFGQGNTKDAATRVHNNNSYLQMGGGYQNDKQLKFEINSPISEQPTSGINIYAKNSNNTSTNNKLSNQNNEEYQTKSLRRQSREDELSAKKKSPTNLQSTKVIIKNTKDKSHPSQIDNLNAESPENFDSSNISYNPKSRQEAILETHNQRNAGNNIQQNAQTMQSINTRQQSAYLQSQLNQSPSKENVQTTNQNNKGEAVEIEPEGQVTQTIYNVDTPKKAYNFQFNEQLSESINNDHESVNIPTIANQSAIEFDNVSSLKQNIKRMQLSEIGQSMQSGAESRVSKQSQRPFKMAKKKAIGGESFVNTNTANEADFAESDKKLGRLMRVPPNFHPNPSQPNLQTDGSAVVNTSSNNNVQNEKASNQKIKQEQASDEMGPHCFLTHQLLGTGSFGEVFLVEEISTGKLMAMKVLSKQKAKEQKLLKYNFAEKEIMARMTIANHPFVVKLYYTFQTSESLFMVMEFCAGGDLSQYLEVEGCFNETKAKQYICEIICAIEALHQNDIIFRDLKPDNIVLDSEGHAMLVDFGLSRQHVKGNSNGADSFCGSYAYLAPEMIKKKGHGKAVDWYLIGVVLYELLTGMPPFYDDDKEILFKNITNQKLEFPSEDELPLTRVCKDFIGQLLNKDPSKRLGIINGIKDIKSHPFFTGVDWNKVHKKKYRQPEAYLAEMALSIIQKDPYALKDHPRTKGKITHKGEPNHLDGWEINLVKNYNVQVKAPIMRNKSQSRV